MRTFLLCGLAAASLHATSAEAQGRWVGRVGGALVPGDRVIGGSAEASFYTDGGARFAEIRNRNVFMAGVRAEWVLEAAGPFAVSSTMEALPLIVVNRRSGSLQDCWSGPGGRPRCQTEQGGPNFGVGVVPFGIKLYFANRRDVRVFASGAAGLVLFSRDMPVAGSRRLNFLVEYGAGAEVGRSAHGAVVVGWKFQHMSNAYTSLLNPGLDANVIYAGLLFRRGNSKLAR